jgi:Tol biopolymer transport system component/DNA-binding winged helix-turn-helix (wHTH) protein
VPDQSKSAGIVRFGVFELDRRTGELRNRGVKIRLQDQPLQILLLLLERPGELVSREEIQARLWPSGTIVEFEHSIGTAIKKLRQGLGDDADTPRYIETLPRRGYRFIGPLESPAPQPEPAKDPGAALAGSRGWWPWAAAMAMLLAAGIAGVLMYLKHETGSGPLRILTRLTFDAGLQFGPTWSPDGRFIAYSADRGGKFDIWVQQVGAVTPVKITAHPGHNWQPDWSPDGNQIIFRSEGEGGGLFVVPALGGPERKISSFGFHPKWSPDGRRILFGNTFISFLNKLYVVGLDGEPPREILTEFLKRSQIAERAVEWYPRSNRLSIWGQGVHGLGFWTVSLDGTGAVESGATAKVAEQLGKLTGHEARRTQFRWGPSGRAIYFEGEWNGVRNVWKITVDPPTMRFVALERLTAGPGPDVDLAISTDGRRLAYAARNERVRVWSYPFDAKSGRLLGDGKAVTPAGFDAWRADVSPDGTKLAYVVTRAGEHELWQTSLPDGPTTLLMRAGHEPTCGIWSPDSRRLGFSQDVGGTAPTIVILPQGGGSANPVTSPSFEGDLADWSSDGQWIVARQAIHNQPGQTELRILLLPLSAAPKAETKARLVTSSQSGRSYEGMYEIRLSPNGRWIVFEAVKGGIAPGGATNATLCVVPVSGGPWIRITDGQSWDDKPRWSPDGKTIYYISSRTGFLNVWGIRFDPEQGHPQGQPFRVTSFESPNLMVADDTDWLSMSLSHDRLVTSMKETSGSIWALHDVDR